MAGFLIVPSANTDTDLTGAVVEQNQTSPWTATGLTNGTEYVAYALSDASSAFTPAAGSSITYVSQHDLATGTSDTLTGAITSSGFWVLVLGNDDADSGVATVTFNGVPPDGNANAANVSGGDLEFFWIAAATTGDVVITTTTSSRNKAAALYKLDGHTATGNVTGFNGSDLVSVPDGAAVISGSYCVAGTTNSVSFTGSSADASIVQGTSNIFFDTASGTKSGTGNLTITATPDGARNGSGGIAFPVA